MKPALIKTEEQYEAALTHVDSLMSAEAGSNELEELELWVRLVEEYENEHYPIAPPDPIEAIRFRMEQQGLRRADLIPFLGSRSRVSEVLSRRRPLTLSMIRKLHEGLGISAESLIRESATPVPALVEEDWQSFPLAEIAKRGWFEGVTTARALREQVEELLGGLIQSYESACAASASFRQSVSASKGPGSPALRAWTARVWQLAQDAKAGQFAPAAVSEAFIAQVARVSRLENGPLVARDLLADVGIRLVVEPQLPGTHLDGAALFCEPGTAIIALTLRYDRVDHFWFTLSHELAHFALHLTGGRSEAIVDDLEATLRSTSEEEADNLATQALIPCEAWREFISKARITESDIRSFARLQRIHPAIVAGRIRRETGDYTRFSSVLGHRQVRRLFMTPASRC